MGRADFLRLGDWNACCDRCGRKRKGSELKKTWNGLYVCPEHWEPRHPQDFVKAVREDPTPPFVRKCSGIRLGDRAVGPGVGSLVLASAAPPTITVAPVSVPPGLYYIADTNYQKYHLGVMNPVLVHGHSYSDLGGWGQRILFNGRFNACDNALLGGPSGETIVTIKGITPPGATVDLATFMLGYEYHPSYPYYEQSRHYYASASLFSIDTVYVRGYDGDCKNWGVYTSSDGVAWTQTAVTWSGAAPDGSERGIQDYRTLTRPILFGTTLCRLVTQTGTTYASTSVNGGVTWIAGSTVSAGSGIDTDSGIVSIANGSSGIMTASLKLWTTVDSGANWNYTNVFTAFGSSYPITDAAVSGDVFLALDAYGWYRSSDGGSTWTYYTFPTLFSNLTSFTAITFGGGYFWAADKGAGKYLLQSSDGITWTVPNAWTISGSFQEFSSLYYIG